MLTTCEYYTYGGTGLEYLSPLNLGSPRQLSLAAWPHVEYMRACRYPDSSYSTETPLSSTKTGDPRSIVKSRLYDHPIMAVIIPFRPRAERQR